MSRALATAPEERVSTLPIWCGVNTVLGNLRRCSSTSSRSAPGRVTGVRWPLAAALMARRPTVAWSRAASRAVRAAVRSPAARALPAVPAAWARAWMLAAASAAGSGPGPVPACFPLAVPSVGAAGWPASAGCPLPAACPRRGPGWAGPRRGAAGGAAGVQVSGMPGRLALMRVAVPAFLVGDQGLPGGGHADPGVGGDDRDGRAGGVGRQGGQDGRCGAAARRWGNGRGGRACRRVGGAAGRAGAVFLLRAIAVTPFFYSPARFPFMFCLRRYFWTIALGRA